MEQKEIIHKRRDLGMDMVSQIKDLGSFNYKTSMDRTGEMKV